MDVVVTSTSASRKGTTMTSRLLANGNIRMSFCFPGACLSAEVDPSKGAFPSEVVNALERAYFRETGAELTTAERIRVEIMVTRELFQTCHGNQQDKECAGGACEQ